MRTHAQQGEQVHPSQLSCDRHLNGCAGAKGAVMACPHFRFTDPCAQA